MSVSANATSLSHGRRNTSLCSALLYESGLKPSLATTHAKAFAPCDATLLGLERMEHANLKKSKLFCLDDIQAHLALLYNIMYNKSEVDYMIAISYSTVRQNFKEYCEKATNDFETIIITRERGKNVVMISEAEYNNLLENIYVRRNPKYYNELLKSIEQLKSGKGKKRELLDD